MSEGLQQVKTLMLSPAQATLAVSLPPKCHAQHVSDRKWFSVYCPFLINIPKPKRVMYILFIHLFNDNCNINTIHIASYWYYISSIFKLEIFKLRNSVVLENVSRLFSTLTFCMMSQCHMPHRFFIKISVAFNWQKLFQSLDWCLMAKSVYHSAVPSLPEFQLYLWPPSIST